MRLKVKNILKIENADIEIGGLTVITGENNSGKSTIGKILFSLLKAAKNVKDADLFSCMSEIRSHLSAIKRMFGGNDSIDMLSDLSLISLDLVEKKMSVDYLSRELDVFAKNEAFSIRKLAIMREHCSTISKILTKLDNPETAYQTEFEAIAKSEFMEPLTSYGQTDSSIFFDDDTTDADGSHIKIDLQKGDITNIRLYGDSSIEDITYIESPLYLHILNTLRLANTAPSESLRGTYRGTVPYHLADMAEKMLNLDNTGIDLFTFDDKMSEVSDFLDDIDDIIGGRFEVIEHRQIVFQQGKHTVPPISVASGIKSFGILERMVKTASISLSKMLIWDEPEIHLHPQWQVAFCKLIVDLVSIGVPILISSHSPYFVQGLRYFAAKKGIENDVKYYMSEEDSATGLMNFTDITDDLNQVFLLLAAPLQEVMNVDSVRKSVR